MSDESNQPLGDLLSGMSLGPAWAKPGGQKESAGKKFPDGKGRGRREDKRSFQDRKGKPRNDRRGQFRERPVPEEILPAPGVEVSLIPSVEAIRLIAKEIHQEARVYPLFNVSKTLLSERARCQAVFEVPEPHPFLWRGLLDESVFLTRDEAIQHLWRSDLRKQHVEEETVETDPPKGSFSAVARCGVSGEWLGPPNFHGYQVKLRQVHREKHSRIPFERYASKVKVEQGEEAVNEWLATMTKKTRWRIKGEGDEQWIDNEPQIRRKLAETCFDEAFEEARCVEVNAAIPATHLSPALMASMKKAGNHARQHPAFLIPAICKVLDAEHLPLFKRQKKLYTGPAKPKPVAPDQVFAERPGIIVKWIRENTPAKLRGLWKEVSPEGDGTPPAEFAADLYWLLQQGHILLFPEDTLVVQELRTPTPPKKKKEKAKPAEAGPIPAEEEKPSADVPATTEVVASIPAARDEKPQDSSGTAPVGEYAAGVVGDSSPENENLMEVPKSEDFSTFVDDRQPAVESAPPVEACPEAAEAEPSVEPETDELQNKDSSVPGTGDSSPV